MEPTGRDRAPEQRQPLSRNRYYLSAALVLALLAPLLPPLPAVAQTDHAGHGATSGTAPAAERKILYYRNPMGLPDTSPVPKKDPMGMDYVPVYADETAAATSGTVTVSADKVQKLGVRTEASVRRSIGRTIRAVGTVAVDERGEYVVAPKFSGWIETLKTNTTGARVKRGDVLMEVYSPDLTVAEQELLSARRTRADLGDAALYRLRNLDVPEDEIDRLLRTGQALRTLPYRAPVDGIVLEKTAVRGMRFGAGDTLFRIADLSHVWVIAEVFEQDLGGISSGQTARMRFNALPGRDFEGTVSFVYPTLSADSRTAKVRIEMANPDNVLKPNLYATVEIDTAATTSLAVPDSAVLDNGSRRIVLVEAGEGRYSPRAVKTGVRADGWIAIEDGLAEGERVVVRANFLIDSESNLKAALAAFAPADTAKPAEATP